MNYLQKIILCISILALCGTLCTCGRYSEPSPVPNSGYPHQYPQH